MRRAVECLREHREPYPAFAMNRRWDMLRANRAAARVAGWLRGGTRHADVVRQFFDPEDRRAVAANWEEVAGDLIGPFPVDDATAAFCRELALAAP